MPKCSYCGKNFEAFRGVMVVDSITGNIRYYCSSKCRKYALMGRRKGKWTRRKQEVVKKEE